jgi:hypothetical protein
MPLPTEPGGSIPRPRELWTGQRPALGKARRRLAGRTRAFRTACASSDKEVWCVNMWKLLLSEFALRQEPLRLKQPLPSVKPIGNLVGLPLFSHRRRMSSQIPRSRD